MTVYLLHFERPYHHAKHYLGFTDDLSARLECHANGNGANIVRVITEAGINWQLARVWKCRGRNFERHLKQTYKNTPKLCPICSGAIAMERMQA